jgi:PEP-CTERM motif
MTIIPIPEPSSLLLLGTGLLGLMGIGLYKKGVRDDLAGKLLQISN